MKCKCEYKNIEVIKDGKYTKLICNKCKRVFKSLIDVNNDFVITKKPPKKKKEKEKEPTK